MNLTQNEESETREAGESCFGHLWSSSLIA
jgi:hypothetical protein